jgi:ABC-2 type transport system permease protein
MSRILAIAKREAKSYFNSPIAYIAALAVVLAAGLWTFFFNQFFDRDFASLRGYFSSLSVILSFILPALTMRCWAEERRLGTAELLLTLPFNESDLVLGKFLGSLALYGAILALTLPVPLMVGMLGELDAGQIFGEYLGAILFGAGALAIGQFVSSLTKNQISAYVLAVVILLGLSQLDALAKLLDLPGFLSGFVMYLSFDYHYDGFVKGLVDTRDLVYFLAVSFVFLFATERVLVSRKWS